MHIKTNILSAVFSLLIFGICVGQQNEAEELKQRLEKESGTERIETLLKLSSLLLHQNTEAALSYTNEALDLSRAYRSDSLEAESIFSLGDIYHFSGDFINAIDQIRNAESMFTGLGLKKRMITAKSVLAAIYSDAGNYSQALGHYFEVLDYGRDSGNTSTEIFALTRIAIIQFKLDEISIARRFFKQSIDKAVESGDWGAQTIALSELAAMEKMQGNRDQAIEYYQEAIAIFRDKNIAHAIPSLLYSIAELQSESADYTLAEETAEYVIKVADSLQNTFLKLSGMILLSNIYSTSDDHTRSNEMLQQVLSLMEDSQMKILEMQAYELMAKNYTSLGNFEEAIRLNQQTLSVALGQKKWATAQTVLLELVQLQEQVNDYKGALEYQKLLGAVSDSSLNVEQKRQIVELETRFNLGEQERQIQLLEKEKEKQSLIQYALASGLFLFMLGGFLIFRMQKQKAQKQGVELENIQLREEKMQHELEYKNKQLTTQSLNLLQKNELMKELKGKISNLGKESSAKDISGLANMVDYSLSLDKDWEQFQLHFEEVHRDFYHMLQEKYPDITPNDLKLCALVKLNLSIKEMAVILGISADSVKTARYRLRKKLHLDTDQNLTDFMLTLERKAVQFRA